MWTRRARSVRVRSEERSSTGVEWLTADLEAEASDGGQADISEVKRPHAVGDCQHAITVALSASGSHVQLRALATDGDILCSGASEAREGKVVAGEYGGMVEKSVQFRIRQRPSIIVTQVEHLACGDVVERVEHVLDVQVLSEMDGEVRVAEYADVEGVQGGRQRRALGHEQHRILVRSSSWLEKQAGVSNARVVFAVCAKVTSSSSINRKLHTCARTTAGRRRRVEEGGQEEEEAAEETERGRDMRNSGEARTRECS